jgi:hypothetical protein
MNNPTLSIKPDAVFSRGDVVLVRDCKRLAQFPRKAIVAAVVPLMAGARYATYTLVEQDDASAARYTVSEKDLTPTGKSVEIGSIKREGAEA